MEFVELLNDLKERILAYDCKTDDSLLQYEEMLPLREEYLQIVKASYVIDDANVLLGEFLQELYSGCDSSHVVNQEIKKDFLHEIFIYTVVVFYKSKDFESLSYILNKSYFGRQTGNGGQVIGFSIFYHHNASLDKAKCLKDGKDYFSGTAQEWIDNIASEYCNKREFAFADVLLTNYAFFGAGYGDNWPWFPITYVYDGEYNTILQGIALQMKSKEVAQRWAKVFGFENISQFRDNLKKVQDDCAQKGRRLRYNMSFQHAQLLTDFIKPEEIGTRN